MKRIICILAVITLLFGVSCAAAEEPLSVPEYDADTVVDFAGYNCIIAQSSNTSGVINHIEDGNPFGYVATTTFADAVDKRMSDVEEALNCKITLKTNSDANSNLAIMLVAGTYLSDALFSSDIQLMYAVGNAGGLLPIAGYDAIDLTDSKKWGEFNVFEMNSVKGEIYGVTPMKWPLRQPHAINTLVINYALATKYSLFDPRENIEAGTWNWDSFEKFMQDYYIVDGELIYKALACRYFDFIKLAVLGNGVDLLYMNDAGVPESGIYSPQAMDAFMWSKDIWMNYSEHLMFSDASPDWTTGIAASLLEQTSIAALAPTWMVYDTFAQQVEQFSVLPFPIGPDGTEGQWPSVLEGSDFFALPLTSREPEGAAYIINMLCEPLDGFETDEDIADYLARNVLFDEQDTGILMNLYKTGKYSYWPEGADNFWRPFGYAMANQTPTEFFEANVEIFQKIIDDYMTPNLAITEYLG